MRALRRLPFGLVALLALPLASAACTDGEEPVPIDFSDTSETDGETETGETDTGTDGTDTDDTTEDPNAEARQQVIDAAEQQCLDDPDLDEGVVRLVDPATDEVMNEYRADCAEVRAAAE